MLRSIGSQTRAMVLEDLEQSVLDFGHGLDSIPSRFALAVFGQSSQISRCGFSVDLSMVQQPIQQGSEGPNIGAKIQPRSIILTGFGGVKFSRVFKRLDQSKLIVSVVGQSKLSHSDQLSLAHMNRLWAQVAMSHSDLMGRSQRDANLNDDPNKRIQVDRILSRDHRLQRR